MSLAREFRLQTNQRKVIRSRRWSNLTYQVTAVDREGVKCHDGSMGNGDFLIAAYGQGNRAKKPAGSGWWMASLDQDECKARTEEVFGCRYDASGKNTSCGVARLNEKTNNLMIIEATTTSVQ